jgi:hypothetical protein
MQQLKSLSRKLIAASVLGLAAAGAQAAFVINFNFSGLDATQQTYFTSAKGFWESKITGYQAGIPLAGLTINASGTLIDGVGGILGAAGPDAITASGGYVLATSGSMFFDIDDINNLIGAGSFGDVILHEMAHVLGFGTLWTNNGVYVNGTGQYTGANALGEYRTEFSQLLATFVPVELGGGAGTANGHWDEVNGGAGGPGDPFRNELMSGWLNAPTWVSRTTIASFADIGYTVNLGNALPQPATLALLLAALPLLVRARSRRQAA